MIKGYSFISYSSVIRLAYVLYIMKKDKQIWFYKTVLHLGDDNLFDHVHVFIIPRKRYFDYSFLQTLNYSSIRPSNYREFKAYLIKK